MRRHGSVFFGGNETVGYQNFTKTPHCGLFIVATRVQISYTFAKYTRYLIVDRSFWRSVELPEKMIRQNINKSFSELVKISWTTAVSVASTNFPAYRAQLLQVLHSSNAEERSAAIASFTEAEDEKSHDDSVALLTDSDT